MSGGGIRRARLLSLVLSATLLSAPLEAEAQLRSGPRDAPLGSRQAFTRRDWFGRPAREPEKREWQRRKNPKLAMFSSFLVPGLGQLYNEREFWALVAAGVHIYFIGDIIVQARLANRYRTLKNIPIDPGDPEQVLAR
ncbi:MAG: DUF5683 domain-containing protein, partial [Candidatus Krumholzibacteriia bacterium]